MSWLVQHKWGLILLGVVIYSVASAALVPDERTPLAARHGVWSHRILGIVRGL